MQNYDQALQYMETAQNSSGESMKKYETYQDSLSGKLEGLKNSFQDMSTTFIGSDFLGGLIDGGTAAIDVITELIDSFGVLSPLMAGLGIFQGAKGGG